jgi:hypothetical protein
MEQQMKVRWVTKVRWMKKGAQAIYTFSPAIKTRYIPSEELMLTDYHMSMLEENIAKFRAADTNLREKIIQDTADGIKRTWTEGLQFDMDAVITVREPSVIFKLVYSQILLAYSPIPVQQGQTGADQKCLRTPKMDVLWRLDSHAPTRNRQVSAKAFETQVGIDGIPPQLQNCSP